MEPCTINADSVNHPGLGRELLLILRYLVKRVIFFRFIFNPSAKNSLFAQNWFMSNMINGAVKDELIDRLNRLTPETKGLWGNMDVARMLTHMNDAFRISLGMKPAVDRSTFFSHNVKFPVAVYVLPFWPKGEATAPELNQQQEGSKPRDFYTELEFLLKMIDVFNEREEAKLKPHPMFGKLTKKQWRNLLIKHLKHHLRQFGV